MPSTFSQLAHAICYEDDMFSLDVLRKKSRTAICMRLIGSIVNTRTIPTVYPVLKKLLPSVLSSTCFNDDDLPFAIEVKSTEIGHLFEHILLEYLCLAKLSLGAENAIYSGNTQWNWHKEPRGTFNISITSGVKDADIFDEALIKTIQLTKFLMQGVTIPKGYIPPFQSVPVSLKNGTSSKNRI